MFKISIPKPCFEGWENMTPNAQGRYCNSCAKTVVDFSVMTDEAVQQYFISNFNDHICGRFKNVQLQRIVIELPQNIFRIQLPFWKKFLVVFLICFGGTFFAIDTTMAGTSFTQGDTFALYKKTNEVKMEQKKPGHHRKKKHRYTIAFKDIKFDPTSWSTMVGLTETFLHPVNPYDPIFDPISYSTIDTGTTVKLSTTDPNQSKKDSTPKIPEPATAFILPAALALRNPFSKKKKA